MKKYTQLFLSLCFILSPFFLFAQDKPDFNPDVKKLELTSSPAFILLGVSPTNIDRPSTPRDFATGVQSSLVNGQIKPNFAMEFNPFNWKKNHQFADNEFNANKYLYANNWGAIPQNISISLATSSSDTAVFGNLKPGLGLGYGIKIPIITGHVNSQIRAYYGEWEISLILNNFTQGIIGTLNYSTDNIEKVYAEVDSAIDKGMFTGLLDGDKIYLKNKLKEKKKEYTNIENEAERKKAIEKDDTKYNAAVKANLEKTNKVNKDAKVPFDREGFTLELAAGGANVLENSSWGSNKYAKSAVWLTPAYRLSLTTNNIIESFDFMGIFRYTNNNQLVDSGNYVDFGLKLQYTREKATVSGEAVWRYATKVPTAIPSNWTYCMLGTFSYLISENITFKASFGTNFNGTTKNYTSPGDIVTVTGLNFGFGK